MAIGREEEAGSVLRQIVNYAGSRGSRVAEELSTIAEGLALLETFKEANEFFIDAREADATDVDAFIGQGELLNEKYNYAEGASLFQDALKINPSSSRAQVGLATSKRFESNEGPVAALDRALTINPNYVPALVFKAALSLEAERETEAAAYADRALAVNSNSVPAMAIHAAIYYLRDSAKELESETTRALAVNPKAGEFFGTLAHFAVMNRRYSDAVDFGRRAVELSPRQGSARTELGIQLLRVGKISEGRAELERAFAGDRYNIWAKNTLDLLDSMRDYQDTVRGPFLIKTSPSETGTVSSYAADLLAEAYRKMTEKYRFTPRAPISVEIFPNHEDFAVRSLGLPGLGALGVCFGQVIAMDGPSARPGGPFNWGSTLWHEFTHVITLQITDHRIPRWFSEGLSVYEERRARPGWGDKWSFERLRAYTAGRFVKIADLDAAFTRPRSPDQVPLAYFQASLVCDFIDETFGFDGILKLLAEFKTGSKGPDALKLALNLSEIEFDRRFDEYVKGKVSGYLDAVGKGRPGETPGAEPTRESLEATLKARPSDFFANLRLGALYKREGDTDRAIEHLKRAAELFPYYTGDGNPYFQLADIYEGRRQLAEAASALEALSMYSDSDIEALKRLARLRLALGDRASAITALQYAFYINPSDYSLHKQAGDVYLELGDPASAIREFRVGVALNPADAAGAHFDLARALEAGGDRREARREVLRALEIAPGFEPAQEFLLRLNKGQN
jgi:tetratricopeptide (TPR) repeat protein